MSARAAGLLSVIAAAGALAGCQSTREKSAELESRAASAVKETGVRIAQPNPSATITDAVVLQDEQATAAVVTVRNRGAAQRGVPLIIDVSDQSGASVYRNDAPGLDPGLTSILALPAEGELTWVNDQLPPGIEADAVKGELGAAETAAPAGEVRELEIVGPRIAGDPEVGIEATGRVRNTTAVVQRQVPVYAVVRRGSRVVAAGRAVIPAIQPGRDAVFHAFLVGDPTGARLEVRAPATTPESS